MCLAGRLRHSWPKWFSLNSAVIWSRKTCESQQKMSPQLNPSITNQDRGLISPPAFPFWKVGYAVSIDVEKMIATLLTSGKECLDVATCIAAHWQLSVCWHTDECLLCYVCTGEFSDFRKFCIHHGLKLLSVETWIMRHAKISLLYGHMLCYSQDIHGTGWTWLMAQATLNFSTSLSSSGCNQPPYCILKICTKANIACIH